MFSILSTSHSQTHRLSLYTYREVKTDYIFGVILGPNLMRIEKSSPGVRDEGVVLPGGGRCPDGHGEHPGGNCIKMGLPRQSILGDYFQENRTSRRPFLLLRISFPGRPIFIQFIPGDADGVRGRHGEDVLHEEGVELDDLPEQHHLQDGHEPHPGMLDELL